MKTTTERPTLSLHAIVYPDTETREFLAHCLELDLMTSGSSAEEASSRLVDVVTTQIQYALDHDNLDYLMHPAPADAWQRFTTLLKSEFQMVTKRLSIENGQRAYFQPQLELALAA